MGVDKIAMEKLASKRSNHRKAIQKTIGSDPSSEIENLVFNTIYNDEDERGRTDDFDEFGRLQSSRYPGMYIGGDDGDELLTANNDVVNSSDRYHELLTQALEERPDLKALYDVDKAQNAKRRHTPIADTMGQTGAILGGVGGLVYPAVGIANSIKNKHYGRAALKGLAYPVSGTVSAALGALVGGVTAGGIGTMIESPIKGVQGLIDKDYKAYDDFTWDQAREIKDMKQRFMSQADREALEQAFGSEIADQVLGVKLAAAFEKVSNEIDEEGVGMIIEKIARKKLEERENADMVRAGWPYNMHPKDKGYPRTTLVNDRLMPTVRAAGPIAKWTGVGAGLGAATGVAKGEAINFVTGKALDALSKRFRNPATIAAKSFHEAFNTGPTAARDRMALAAAIGALSGGAKGFDFGRAMGNMDRLDELYVKNLARLPYEDEYRDVVGYKAMDRVKKYQGLFNTPESMVKSEIRKMIHGENERGL